MTHLETSQGLQRIERVAVYEYVGHVNCFENDSCKRGAQGWYGFSAVEAHEVKSVRWSACH